MDENTLKSLLKGMDVPEHRKNKVTPQNLRWLLRNLGIRNSGHKNYHTAINGIKAALK